MAIITVVHFVCVTVHLKILPFAPSDPEQFCPGIIANDLLDRDDPDWYRRDSWIPTVVKAAPVVWKMIVSAFTPLPDGPIGCRTVSLPLFLCQWYEFYSKNGRVIACMGNVLVWWPVVAGLLMTTYLFWGRIFLSVAYFPALLAGYVFSMAQWIFTLRQVYITDYSISLLFGLYLLAGLTDKLAKGRVKGFVLTAVVAAGVAGFLLWAPLLYGMAVQDVDFFLWRRGWRQ
jgi:hypothetical protein